MVISLNLIIRQKCHFLLSQCLYFRQKKELSIGLSALLICFFQQEAESEKKTQKKSIQVCDTNYHLWSRTALAMNGKWEAIKRESCPLIPSWN